MDDQDDELDALDLPDDDEVTARPGPSTGKASPLQQGTVVPKGWKPTLEKPLPATQCKGTVRNGPRTGQRCGRWAPPGSPGYCRVHGGQLPNHKSYAQERIEEARLRLIGFADDAVDTLFDLMTDPTTPEQVRLAAARDVLDRANVKSSTDIKLEVEHKVSPVENIKSRLANIAKRVENPVDIGEITGSESSPEDEDASDTDD